MAGQRIASFTHGFIFIIFALCTIIATGKLCYAQDNNPIYKYPDLYERRVGMQPIIDEADLAPAKQQQKKPTLQPKQELTEKPAAAPIITPVPATAPIAPVPAAAATITPIAKAEPIAKPIPDAPIAKIILQVQSKDLTEESLRQNKNLTKLIKIWRSKDDSHTITLVSSGVIGNNKSISAAKRHALSHALLMRQYLIDNDISSRKIDMDIRAVPHDEKQNDEIEFYEKPHSQK